MSALIKPSYYTTYICVILFFNSHIYLQICNLNYSKYLLLKSVLETLTWKTCIAQF